MRWPQASCSSLRVSRLGEWMRRTSCNRRFWMPYAEGSGNRIAALGPSGEVQIPDGAEILELEGHTVIPGIVGLHDHTHYQGAQRRLFLQMSGPRMYLGSGVTTIRTAGSFSPYAEITLKAAIDAEATITENIVEDVVTWGIAFWDAGHGAPVATIHDNVVYRAGACGAALTRREEKPAPGSFRGNALVATGQDARFDDPELYCKQEPLAREAIPASFVIQDNLFHDNRMAGGGPSPRDASRASFLTQVAPLTSRLKARPALQTSTFLTDYGAGR